MKAFRKKSSMELYLEFVNDFLTIDRMAEYYGVSAVEMEQKVKEGAKDHAEEVERKKKEKEKKRKEEDEEANKLKLEIYAICTDDSKNPDIGQVDVWVEKGRVYKAGNLSKSKIYEKELVFNLFNSQDQQLIPNETYRMWRSKHFILFPHYLN